MKIVPIKIANQVAALITLIWVCHACTTPIQTQIPEEKAENIQSLLKEASVTGMQLAYFDNESDYRFSAGYRSAYDSTTVNDETIFEAASLSKQVTATLALRLVEEGFVQLDEPISKAWRDPRVGHEPHYDSITIAHLLSHASGLPNWGGDTLSLNFTPGTAWQYSGEGYVLLAKTLEAKMDKDFNELCQEWIFEPLMMANSSFVWQPAFTNNVTEGHTSAEIPKGTKERLESNPAASLYTTASDYMKMIRAIFLGDFLKDETKARLIEQVQVIQSWDGAPTGLGWTMGLGTSISGSEKFLWQWGDNYLHRGFFMIDPNGPRSLVYLTNSQNGLSILEPILGHFFEGQHDQVTTWLDYQPYDDPELRTSILLEKAFYWQGEEEAEDILRTLVSADSAVDDNMLNNAVWSLFENKKLAPALRLVETYLELQPNSAEAFARKGEALGFAHDYANSWIAYQEAMRLNPDLTGTLLPRFPWYQEATQALQRKENATPNASYVGTFGGITISLQDNELIYDDEFESGVLLYRLSNEAFDLENLATFRLLFEFANGEVVAVTKSHLSGDKERFARQLL